MDEEGRDIDPPVEGYLTHEQITHLKVLYKFPVSTPGRMSPPAKGWFRVKPNGKKVSHPITLNAFLNAEETVLESADSAKKAAKEKSPGRPNRKRKEPEPEEEEGGSDDEEESGDDDDDEEYEDKEGEQSEEEEQEEQELRQKTPKKKPAKHTVKRKRKV